MKTRFLLLIATTFASICATGASYDDMAQAQMSRGVQIALVTFDTNVNHNIVVWQRFYEDSLIDVIDKNPDVIAANASVKSLTINSYSIYRQDSAHLDFNYLGQNSHSNIGVYEDMTADPSVQSYKYKVTANISYQIRVTSPMTVDLPPVSFETEIDSCRYHKTLFFSKDTTGEDIIYKVEPYEVEGFDLSFITKVTGMDSVKVDIYRHSVPELVMTNLHDSTMFNIGDTIFTYVDDAPDVTSDTWYYAGVITLRNPVDPAAFIGLPNTKASSGPFSQSISNLEDNRLKETPSNTLAVAETAPLQLYPNPVNENTIIYFENVTNGSSVFRIYDALGNIVGQQSTNYLTQGAYTRTLESISGPLTPGVYILEVVQGDQQHSIKFIAE